MARDIDLSINKIHMIFKVMGLSGCSWNKEGARGRILGHSTSRGLIVEEPTKETERDYNGGDAGKYGILRYPEK